MPYSEDPAEQLPDYFVTAESISPKEHVAIQGRSPEVDRFIDFQDRQCADRLPV